MFFLKIFLFTNKIFSTISRQKNLKEHLLLVYFYCTGAIIGLIIELIYKYILKKSPPGLFGRPAPPPPTVKTSEITSKTSEILSKTTEVTAKAA